MLNLVSRVLIPLQQLALTQHVVNFVLGPSTGILVPIQTKFRPEQDHLPASLPIPLPVLSCSINESLRLSLFKLLAFMNFFGERLRSFWI